MASLWDIVTAPFKPVVKAVSRAADFLFGGGSKPSASPLYSPPPPPSTINSAASLEDAAAKERKIRGRASTILTGGLGLEDAPPVSRRVLLGA